MRRLLFRVELFCQCFGNRFINIFTHFLEMSLGILNKKAPKYIKLSRILRSNLLNKTVDFGLPDLIFSHPSRFFWLYILYWLQYVFVSSQEIHWAAFRNLRILVELDLSYNNLTHLQPETFAGNERLQTLTLSHNKIAALSPYVFPYIKHLKSIDLSHNYIEDIQRNTFENLGNSVESLNVDNNRLSTLREEVFLPLTNLKSLQVSKY